MHTITAIPINLHKIHKVLDWAAEGLCIINDLQNSTSSFSIFGNIFQKDIPKYTFLEKSIAELKHIFKIELYQFITKHFVVENLIISLPKLFLTARLKSTLFNDNYNEVSLYA